MPDPRERENAQRKLGQVLQFSELQTCRRKYLLEYFDEPWDKGNCGGCDICSRPREEYDATDIANKILSTVIRTGERFGPGHVVNVLRGVPNEQIRKYEHNGLTVFGVASDSSADDLRQSIEALVERGLLAKESLRYQTLTVTDTGQTFLKNRETLTLIRLEQDPEKASSSSAGELPRRRRTPSRTRPNQASEAASSSATEELSFDPVLFEELRALRKRMADERSVPPYVIFHDSTLKRMAYSFPQSLDTFGLINGVGKAKLNEFGEQFLSVTLAYARDHGLVDRTGPPRQSQGRVTGKSPDPTMSETKKLLLEGLPIAEIAERRGLAERTIVGHLERLVVAGEELDLAHLMPSTDRMAHIRGAFHQTGDPRLAPVRELLGEDYSYQELALGRIGLRQRGLLS
jgi:ATP-dependent DNA helicase RecQ